ncbi:MAG: hypothetical protein KDJ38_15580 [Gammaproteobacteria bacterium]|nr:hypothetical protein [Gammaproteobacteria bacterium]
MTDAEFAELNSDSMCEAPGTGDGDVVQVGLLTENWSSPATWANGKVPEAGDDVIIPVDKTVVLDTDLSVKSITVQGALVCGDSDVDVQVNTLHVTGRFQCGTALKPHTKELVVTLSGVEKIFSASGNGVVEIHGQKRTGWLMLDQTAEAGDRSIVVDDAANWRRGDSIVISSTDEEMEHAEVRTIREINGNVITLDKKLAYRHFGEIQSFANNERVWNVDTRAEVGLLSRNIRIQGDVTSEKTSTGGHIMIMGQASAYVSGVELYKMGQMGQIGKYPFHWHMIGDADNQYFTNNSIHKSYNRCVTVHATNNTLVADNVCYDHIGHGYFLEDGVETGNVFDHNLGLLTRRPKAKYALLPSDIMDRGKASSAARGPATFWISNGDNTFTNNAAAGSEGLGFWYDTKTTPIGASADLPRYNGVNPQQSVFGEFADNRVHSSAMAFSSCNFAQGAVGYNPPEKAVYKNLTVFHGGTGAVWPCSGDQEFDNLMVTDTGETHFRSAFVAPSPVEVKNSLFVSNSELAGGNYKQRGAFGIYDFGTRLTDIHVVNYSTLYENSPVFTTQSAAVRVTSNPVSGMTFENTDFLMNTVYQFHEASEWGAVVHDEDGSFGLGANTVLVPDHEMMIDSSCTALQNGGHLCNKTMGLVRLDIGSTNLPPITHIRSDGVRVVEEPIEARDWYQSTVSLNQNAYHYAYELDDEISRRSNQLNVRLDFSRNQDEVIVELRNLPAHSYVDGNVIPVNGMAALRSVNQTAAFKANGSLFIKLVAQGQPWQASDNLRVLW